jgi:agmatinase
MTFDPDAAGKPGSGIFGLPFTREESKIVVLPVPFDATTSYGHGTHRGPDAVYNASMQVDLYDRRFGRIYEKGIFLEEASESIRELSERARRLALPLIEKGGADGSDEEAVSHVNAAGEKVNGFVYEETRRALVEGRVPALLGGDHSTPFGAILACAERSHELGILQFDAHMDFRDAYEGFKWSHASIMHNVLVKIPQVTKLVQVGIRDFGEGEMDFGIEQGRRVETHFDDAWAGELAEGAAFADLCKRAIASLPKNIYISFDIDALEPGLCPNTGTPVPGGLTFNQITILLDELRKSGRHLVGFDLVEVSPCSSSRDQWDANVGARILYKLCGLA